MREELSRKGKPVALVMFEGEQHGFRRQENIEACLRGTFYFLGKVFGFKPALEEERSANFEIENL